MAPLLRRRRARFVRQRMLGSEAVYEILAAEGDVVTARVLRAPGLAPGSRVRLTAQAANAMERLEPAAVAGRLRPRPAWVPAPQRSAGASDGR